MFSLEIQSSTENYEVIVGARFTEVIPDYDAVIADEIFRHKLDIAVPIYWVTSSEQNKTLSTVETICAFLREAGLTRSGRILAIGGGVIQDLATLAASLYMRGVRWAYMPTTLTGMMDSCLGGKSSINVGAMKNLVGNIYPPERIYIDPSFIETLDRESIDSGLAEGVKIAFARGNEAFTEFVDNASAENPGNDASTSSLILHSLSCKKWFIEIDEFDKAERQLLNFGHSFGHAFEAASNFGVQHGIGVALGVLAATEHPLSTSTPESERLAAYCRMLTSRHIDRIRSASQATDWSKFESSLRSDKKNSRENLVLVLPKQPHQLARVEIPFDSGAVALAREVMQSTLTRLLAED